MINQAEIVIPYPKRFGFISINSRRKVNMSFDNLALFVFREDNEIESGEDLKKWQSRNGEYDLMIEMLWSACKSWHLHNQKQFKFEKRKFALGIAQADAEQLKEVMKIWKRSQSFGVDKIKKKQQEKD